MGKQFAWHKKITTVALTALLGLLFNSPISVLGVAHVKAQERSDNVQRITKEDPSLYSEAMSKAGTVGLNARFLKSMPLDQVIVRVTLNNGGKIPINSQQGNNAATYFVQLWDDKDKLVLPNAYGQTVFKHGAVWSNSLAFRSIEPGQSWAKEMNISSWFDLQVGKTYKLSVRCPPAGSGCYFAMGTELLALETSKAAFTVKPAVSGTGKTEKTATTTEEKKGNFEVP